MAGTVTPDLTTISLCEVDDWVESGGTDSLNDPLLFDARQGSYCIQNYGAAAANRGSDKTLASATDLSDTTIYCWFAFSKVPHATNPMRIIVTDAAGNWREWNIFTKATLPHLSWIAWALKTTVAYDAQSATAPNMTAITKVGWRMDAVIAKVYIYRDAWRFGTGLSIKAGTDASPAVLEDFYTADNDSTNAYGVIEKYNGVYYSQGQLKIGSTTAGDATYFKDLNQILIFKSIKGNPTGFYEIKRQGNATATTKILLGIKSGTVGISGCVIKAFTEKFKLTVSDTNITEFGFYACTLINADTITGQAYSTLKEFLSSTFTAGAEMLPGTGIVKDCKFISSPAEAVRMSSTSHNITNCVFISCSRAVHITVAGPFSFSDLDFTGNTYDAKNISGVSVTVNYDQYCSPAPSTYDPAGNTITFQASVTLIVRHVKTGIEPTEYVSCAIYRKSDMVQIMNKDANVADDQNPGYYKASESWTQTGIVVIVRARETGYLPFETELTIPAGGLDVSAIWIVDPYYV